MTEHNKKLFDENYSIIANEIKKRRNKWSLTSISHMNYEDVSQILLLHIYKKIHLWDQEKAIEPWINTIITHQISNLIRNNYSNFTPPCLNCEANDGFGGCQIYEKQCVACPLYSIWTKTKKNAHNLKLPSNLENNFHEVSNIPFEDINFEKSINNLHDKIKPHLTKSEWSIYECLFIFNLSDEETAKRNNLKATESAAGRKDYKRIRQVKKIIIEKSRKLVYCEDNEIIE